MPKKCLKHTTAKSEWLIFSNDCLKGCSDIQIKEMQKAFYAGIISALDIVTSIPEGFTEEQHSEVFRHIFGEAESFITALNKPD